MVPTPGQIFTVRDILTVLTLKDSPTLMVPVPKKYRDITDFHPTCAVQGDDSKILEAIADFEFIYQYTTTEWIPIFKYAGDYTDQQLLDKLEFELYLDAYHQVGWPPHMYSFVKGDDDSTQYYKWMEGDTLMGAYADQARLAAPELVQARDALAAAQ